MRLLSKHGTTNDFIGHSGGDNFIVITAQEAAEPIRQALKNRFASEVETHYNFIDRQQGYVTTRDENGQESKHPLMSLAVGVVSPAQHQFADIREITELAAKERRKDG